MVGAPREEQLRASQRVSRFVERFEPGYYDLLCHAALPLVLTPELVSYLRNEFLRGLPWMAEVDLLLSDLCAPIGYELYVMNTDIRAYLLEQDSERFNAERKREVANLLISYVSYLAKHSGQMSPRELESQQWAGMVYLGPAQREKAVEQIVSRMQVSGEQIGGNLLSRAELSQLAEITQALRNQLREYPELLAYAALVSDVQLHSRGIDSARVEKSYGVLPGQFLRLPSMLQQELIVKNRLQQPDDLPRVSTRAAESTAQALNQDFAFEELEFTTAQIVKPGEAWPVLQQETVTVAEVVLEPVLEPESSETEVVLEPVLELESFEFESGQLERRTSNQLVRRREVAWVLVKQRQQGRQFVEVMGNRLRLEMVALPEGQFTMGSPDNEEGHLNSERPQHEVVVAAFWIGKYPVTQAQWRYVAGLPQVEIELPTDPSRFRGDDRPVEQVTWHEATEFCIRLAAHTGRPYRLPTEAEWEYACRAGTDTPFHVGETITPKIANYDSSSTYGDGPKGECRKETTLVGEFGIVNRFGLYDMHGNVWEWCQDHWHDNYENAPTDGSAWISKDEEANSVLRGGAWIYNPKHCRSASRGYFQPDVRISVIGFRICCSPPGL